MRHPKEDVEVVLVVHDPEVPDDDLAAPADLLVGLDAREVDVQPRPVSHDRHGRRRNPASVDGDLTAGLVDRDHMVGRPIADPFRRLDRTGQPAKPLSVADLEQLGHEVVLVEDDALAQQLVRRRDEPQQVGRVGHVDDVEPARSQNEQAQAQLRSQRHDVLEEVTADRRLLSLASYVTKDVETVADLALGLAPFARADQ